METNEPFVGEKHHFVSYTWYQHEAYILHRVVAIQV